jgi:uncharacterized protein with von Willebrand factor type A (vWA) domain
MEARTAIASAPAEPHAGAPRFEEIQLDLPAVVGAFSQRLHDCGMSVTPAQSGQYVRALQLTQPGSRRQLYFTTRAIFVTDVRDVATFDRVFAEVFDSPATSHSPIRAQSNPSFAAPALTYLKLPDRSPSVS